MKVIKGSYWTQAIGEPPRWWEQFLEIEMHPRWHPANRFQLRVIETGEVVATGGSLKEIDDRAIRYLNRLFEEIVLG